MSRNRDDFEDPEDNFENEGPEGFDGEEGEDGDSPASFEHEELTTSDVRELARDAQEAEAGRNRNNRRTQANVEQTQRPNRSHTTPAKVAARNQTPKRELPVVWREGTNLEAPPPPRGLVTRWIRYQIGDRPDTKNLSKKFRQGWRPYLIKDCPQDYMPPEIANTVYGEAIAIGDLLLCVMPRELWKQRQKFYRERQARQFKAAHNKFRAEEDPRVPIRQKNEDTFSRGAPRRPKVGDDE